MSRQLRHTHVRKTYEFIKSNQEQFGVRVVCRVPGIAPSGYSVWLKKPPATDSKMRVCLD